MGYHDFTMYGGGVFFTLLFWLLFIAATAFLISKLLHNGETHHEKSIKVDPLDIAKERYAKGEITTEEFDTIKKNLLK